MNELMTDWWQIIINIPLPECILDYFFQLTLNHQRPYNSKMNRYYAKLIIYACITRETQCLYRFRWVFWFMLTCRPGTSEYHVIVLSNVHACKRHTGNTSRACHNWFWSLRCLPVCQTVSYISAIFLHCQFVHIISPIYQNHSTSRPRMLPFHAAHFQLQRTSMEII